MPIQKSRFFIPLLFINFDFWIITIHIKLKFPKVSRSKCYTLRIFSYLIKLKNDRKGERKTKFARYFSESIRHKTWEKTLSRKIMIATSISCNFIINNSTVHDITYHLRRNTLFRQASLRFVPRWNLTGFNFIECVSLT